MEIEWREFKEDNTVEHVARLPFATGLVPLCWGDMETDLTACVIEVGPENDRSYFSMARIDSESGNTQVLITNPIKEEDDFKDEAEAKAEAIRLLNESADTMIASLEGLKAAPDKLEWKRKEDGKYNTMQTRVLLSKVFAPYGAQGDEYLELAAWAFPCKEENKFTPSVVISTESDVIKQLLTDPADCPRYDKEEDAMKDAGSRLLSCAEAILENLYKARKILKAAGD